MQKVKSITIVGIALALVFVVIGCGETKSASTTPTPNGVIHTSLATQDYGQINHGQGDVYSCLVCHNTNPNAYPKKDNPNLACMTCHALLLGVTSKPLATTGVVATTGVIAHPSYSKDVQPILQSECGTCHIDIMTYGKTKERVSAGKPEESMLIKRINGSLVPMMPVDAPLSKDQVQTITNWIKDGAENN